VRNNLISNSILCILLIAISIAAFTTYRLETQKRALKVDIIELSDIKYGMFNVDAWEEQFATIITKKLEELELSGTQREEARAKVAAFLNESIDKFERAYIAKNEQKNTVKSFFQNLGADFFEIFGELKAQVPVLTDDIIDFLESEENRDGIKNYIIAQINSYTEGTFQKLDYSAYNAILAKYGTNNGADCIALITKKLNVIRDAQSISNIVLVVAFLTILLLMLFIFKEPSNFKITLYVIAAVHLLALGVFLPMIDIDARIASMELQLMGEAISFKDQVLYYKSKSIMEVSSIMLSQGKIKVMLVGILVLLFSVIFPISKLISSLFLVFKRSLERNKFIRFMVFKSGKWSMADVMVVAIFMSYIGFTGIISSQLGQLENSIESLEILSTNKSELQNGFYFFMSFVIMSIFISQRIQKMVNSPKTEEVVIKN
jgi:hypothetical protein